MRAHVSMPQELIDEVDAIAGKRKRSAFIEDAVREKLLRARQVQAFEKFAGVLKGTHPEWDTPEAVSAWVRKSREMENQRLEEILDRTKE